MKADFGGVNVVVDTSSAQLLEGATLDYKDGLQQAGFAIDNPNKPKRDPVFINVEQDNKVYIGAKETSIDTLVYDITAALSVDSANPRDEQVMIRANRYVPYKDFMEVLNTLQTGGYLKIGLIAEDL